MLFYCCVTNTQTLRLSATSPWWHRVSDLQHEGPKGLVLSTPCHTHSVTGDGAGHAFCLALRAQLYTGTASSLFCRSAEIRCFHTVEGFLLVFSKVQICAEAPSGPSSGEKSFCLFQDHLQHRSLLRAHGPPWCRICLIVTLFLWF